MSNPSFTRKHYRLIAEIIARQAYFSGHRMEDLIHAALPVLTDANQNFDKAVFIKAVIAEYKALEKAHGPNI